MIQKKDCNPTIDELYQSRFPKDGAETFKVSAYFKEAFAPFGVILTGNDQKADCKVSSFTENIYFRTRNGENFKRYTSIEGLEKAIKTAALKYGYTLNTLMIEKGEPDRI